MKLQKVDLKGYVYIKDPRDVDKITALKALVASLRKENKRVSRFESAAKAAALSDETRKVEEKAFEKKKEELKKAFSKFDLEVSKFAELTKTVKKMTMEEIAKSTYDFEWATQTDLWNVREGNLPLVKARLRGKAQTKKGAK